MNKETPVKRGGQPEWEIDHGKHLKESGAEAIWGWDTPAGRQRVLARAKWLSDCCRLASGRKVLECGCGTGVFTRQLAGTGAEITAVDISEDLLAEARQAIGPAKNVRFQTCNLEDPASLEDESFDAVVGVSVLHHLDMEIALPALLRKLRPGGQVAFSEPNMSNPINKHVIFTDDLQKRASSA
jgi:2-polyprenyl-3-methyl-5-hydroxy-6-metoxy-1,4-benzoquinol methylase